MSSRRRALASVNASLFSSNLPAKRMYIATTRCGPEPSCRRLNQAPERKGRRNPGRRSPFTMSTKKLSVGDRVEWDTPQGKTVGRAEKKLTRPMKIKAHKVAASPQNPEYLVRTEKSRKLAAHQPTELRKLSR